MTAPLTDEEQRRHHALRDPHVHGRWLSDLVLGAQDGIVNTLGVLLGVASATSSTNAVFATGLAAAVAESISMAAVAYTSSLARGELYSAEREREYRHIDVAPGVEREEIRALFLAKGFTGDLLERAVDVVCSNREVWVQTMMLEEHALAPIDRRASLRSAAVVGSASLVASALPVLPFAWLGLRGGVAATIAVSLVLLLVLGALKGRLTTGRTLRSAFELAAIGTASALAGWVVGTLAG